MLYRNLIALILITAVISQSLFAQEIMVEKSHELETLKKDTYIGDAYFDPETEETQLVYVEMDPFKSSFVTYTFDKNLDYVGEEAETYRFKDQMADINLRFPWFKYRGEEYTVDILSVAPLLGGKIQVQKIPVTYKWALGTYWPSYGPAETLKIKGLEEEKLYLYDFVSNYETMEVLLLVGLKGDNFSQCREFQLIKVTSDNEVQYLDKISFDFNVAISFNRIMKFGDPDDPSMDDLFNGKWVLMFSPIKTMLGKKYKTDDPSQHKMVIINEDGSINNQFEIKAPTSGWVLEDYVMSDDGKTVFFYGPAKEDAYVNQLMPMNTPLQSQEEVKEIKYRDFQILKMVDKDIAWIKSTNIDEFEEKVVSPPSQKKAPTYTGKKFFRTGSFITPDGELLITGQEYNRPFNAPEEINYLDLIMFHFNSDGSLKAQYGVKRENNNQHAKANVTPQYIYYNPDGTEIYWIYGEIDGYRGEMSLGGGLLEAAGVGTLRKGKLLFYPAVAKINLANATLGDFVYPGSNEKGKQDYYTNPQFPQYYSPSSNTLIFFGEDKKGKEVWLSRMQLK